MIPKKAYFFWGSREMSWLRYMTLYSFCKMNPDWDVTLYTYPQMRDDKYWIELNEQDYTEYEGEDYFDKVADLPLKVVEWQFVSRDKLGPSHLSNIFKWQKLGSDAGVYLDMDILFIKPMDDLYEEAKEYNTWLCFTNYFSIGFLASAGKNKLFTDTYRHSVDVYRPTQYQGLGVTCLYSMLRVPNTKIHTGLDAVLLKYPELSIFNIPMDCVYPFDSFNAGKYFLELHKELPDNCLGLHWYAGWDVAQRFNNNLTPDSYQDYPCTVTHHLHEVLK